MPYICSSDNRLFCALESAVGQTPAITGEHRFPAVKLSVRQKQILPTRRDKSGTRTFRGIPSGSRRETLYSVKTCLTSWADPTIAPGYGPLIEAALGAAPEFHTGRDIASANGMELTFVTPHGLTPGQAVAVNGEIRFVSSVLSSTGVLLNAPFGAALLPGTPSSPTITYRLSRCLPTASIFDYWEPAGAAQRIICGAAVDELRIGIHSDFHEFEVSGPARDVIDSVSFAEGDGGMDSFPEAPVVQLLDMPVVPGHLGQVWLGPTAERFYTLTSAEVRLSNNLQIRTREFGLEGMRAVVPGDRDVRVDFALYAADDAATSDLYAAARQRSPIHVMFQLGQFPQQLMGVYLKSVTPETPEFDDGEPRLAWKFRSCRAQGSAEDEIVIAFA